MNNIFNKIECRVSKDKNHCGMKKILNKLGNPQDELKIIHVAGTNGKGSTCNYLNNILMADGYKVGLFTSPHIYEHNERIKINNLNIDTNDYFFIYNLIEQEVNEYDLGMFEIDFIVAMQYFKNNDCEYVIVEVGIGGLCDCTNIVTPIISAITSVSFDHQKILGHTIAEIAKQKAGIIKNNIPCVCFRDNKEALEIIRQKCLGCNSDLIIIDDCSYCGNVFYYKDIKVEDLEIPKYQLNNLRIAIEISKNLNIKNTSIVKGIKYSYWPGRYEIIRDKPLIIIDGSHNVDAINKLLVDVPNDINVIFSASEDKEYGKIINILKKKANNVVLVEFNNPRCFDAEKISHEFNVNYCKDLKKAVEGAFNSDQDYLICGSLYLVSDVLKIINSLKK